MLSTHIVLFEYPHWNEYMLSTHIVIWVPHWISSTTFNAEYTIGIWVPPLKLVYFEYPHCCLSTPPHYHLDIPIDVWLDWNSYIEPYNWLVYTLYCLCIVCVSRYQSSLQHTNLNQINQWTSLIDGLLRFKSIRYKIWQIL
jgi:hypothetical protein